MTSTFSAFILGMIQGLTEFLPVSSSGHLVLAPYFFNWTDPGLAFDVALHMGTLAAVLIFFWRDWFAILRHFPKKPPNGVSWKYLVIATIPAAVAGATLNNLAEEKFRNPLLIAGTLSFFGILLWLSDKNGGKKHDIGHLNFRESLIIGCAQALAIIPGTSRSGITITAALFLGLTRPAALRFSFLLSAPIIAGAGLMKSKAIIKVLSHGGDQAQAVVIGFLSSMMFGLLAVGILQYLVKKRTFTVFAVYRLILAAVIVAVALQR